MIKEEFKKGDRVELIDGKGINARIGSRATVVGCNGWLTIIWDRPVLGEDRTEVGQMDGGYVIKQFRKISGDWDD